MCHCNLDLWGWWWLRESEWVWNLFHFILTLAWLGDDGDDSQTQLTLCSHTEQSTRVEIFYEIEGGWLGKKWQILRHPRKMLYSIPTVVKTIQLRSPTESWKVKAILRHIAYTQAHTTRCEKSVEKSWKWKFSLPPFFSWFWLKALWVSADVI